MPPAIIETGTHVQRQSFFDKVRGSPTSTYARDRCPSSPLLSAHGLETGLVHFYLISAKSG
eukprot:scaffold91999_cov35-Prasinocladus_malaysianus.AAC.1